MLHLVNANAPSPGIDLYDLFSDEGYFEHLKRRSEEAYFQMEAVDEHGHNVFCRHVDIPALAKMRVYRLALASNLIKESTSTISQTKAARFSTIHLNEHIENDRFTFQKSKKIC